MSEPLMQPRLRDTPPGSAPRPRRLIGISLLPAAATLGNALCGFGAFVACLLSVSAAMDDAPVRVSRIAEWIPTYISAGVCLIVLSLIFDALDGRLARLTRRTSAFGAQLDSLADIISFGAAPAALAIAVLEVASAGPAPETRLEIVQWRLALLAALIYVSCAAIRLARYNVESTKGEEALKTFSGLPTPGAAILIIGLVAMHERVVALRTPLTWIDLPGLLRWVVIAALVIAGLLMVSRVEYVHVFNQYVRQRRPPTDLIWLLVGVGVGVFSLELLLFVLGVTYIVSGIVLDWRRRRGAGATRTPA